MIKAFLRAKDLAEVRDGGLGGHSVANLVVAHIQETMKQKKATDDFGELLISFFHRFGLEFDSNSQAVSVTRGGIVPKHSLSTCESHKTTNHSYGRKWGQHRGSYNDVVERCVASCTVSTDKVGTSHG